MHVPDELVSKYLAAECDSLTEWRFVALGARWKERKRNSLPFSEGKGEVHTRPARLPRGTSHARLPRSQELESCTEACVIDDVR